MSQLADGAAEMRRPVLEADGITVHFGGLVALSDVSLDVEEGTVVGLVGPNGAGKTTLFAVLSGLLRPSAGRIILRGEDVTRRSCQSRARIGLGRSFQQPQLFAGLSVSEHFLLAYRSRGSRRRIWTDLVDGSGWRGPTRIERDRVEKLLDLLGLMEVADSNTSSLPTGLARLVEVGRALAGSPSVILLDEPAAGLDAYETEELAGALRRAVLSERIAVVLVEHDIEFVLNLGSHIYVLDSGQLIASGTPARIRSDPAVRAAYLGREDIA
jgi:ABC-type branched-subunit amino acid transport system ATPase component